MNEEIYEDEIFQEALAEVEADHRRAAAKMMSMLGLLVPMMDESVIRGIIEVLTDELDGISETSDANRLIKN
jgi:hypothetical protein